MIGVIGSNGRRRVDMITYFYCNWPEKAGSG